MATYEVDIMTPTQAVILFELLRKQESQDFMHAVCVLKGWDYYPHFYGLGQEARDRVYAVTDFLEEWKLALLAHAASISDEPPKKKKALRESEQLALSPPDEPEQ